MSTLIHRIPCLLLLILPSPALAASGTLHHVRGRPGWGLTVSALSRGGAASDPNKRQPFYPKDALVANPFVESAPFILAAAARDGSVALVAAHMQVEQGPEPEPLMYQENPFRQLQNQEDTAPTQDNDNDDNQTNTTTTTALRDKNDTATVTIHNLPRNFGGPYRIHSLLTSTNENPSLFLLVTGWRADCDAVLDAARAIVNSERHQLGSDAGVSGDIVATRLSTQLFAQRAAAEHARSLSCTAMIVSSRTALADDEEDNNKQPQIWLVDATGAHPVRALCVGRDATAVNSNCLCRQDFATAQQALGSLVDFLRHDMKDLTSVRLELAQVEPTGLLSRVQVEDCS